MRGDRPLLKRGNNVKKKIAVLLLILSVLAGCGPISFSDSSDDFSAAFRDGLSRPAQSDDPVEPTLPTDEQAPEAPAQRPASGKKTSSGAKNAGQTASSAGVEEQTVSAAEGDTRSEIVTAVFKTGCRLNVPLAKKERFTDPDNGVTLPYRLFVPENYNAAKKYPLLLYLHGAGELGDDNEQHILYFKKAFAVGGDLLREAIILCPKTDEWWELDRALSGDRKGPLGSVMRLLARIRETYSCDPGRIYVTGLSMGGYGAWTLLGNYTSVFAAGIPVCGAGHPVSAAALTGMPLRIFHGTADSTVPFEVSSDFYNEIVAAGGKKAKLIALPGVGHGAWEYAYTDRDTWCWLFAQHKTENPTCDYENVSYFRIVDPAGRTVISETDISDVAYSTSFSGNGAVVEVLTLSLNWMGQEFLNTAYAESKGGTFTVYWLGTRILTFTANAPRRDRDFPIVGVFDSDSASEFYSTVKKLCGKKP